MHTENLGTITNIINRSNNMASSSDLPSNVREAASDEAFDAAVAAAGQALVVACFWAPWHAPSVQLMGVAAEAARDHPEAVLVKVEAEKAAKATERLGVRSVPAFVFLRGGKEAHRVEGANAPAFVSALAAQAARPAVPDVPPPGPASSGPPAAAAAAAPAGLSDGLRERIRSLVAAKRVVLFMKGTPEEPRCGFSRRAIALLSEYDVDYGTFDILGDQEVRQGLKIYSEWPTYPQLYADNELVGGLDIVTEMHAEGELGDAIGAKKK